MMQRLCGMRTAVCRLASPSSVAQAPMLASVANVTPLARALRVLPQHSGYQRSEAQQRVLGLPIRAYQSAELAPAEAATPKRVFADWTVYKGSAALCLKVIKPTWSSSGGDVAIKREGVLLLEFASVNKQGTNTIASGGARDYSWDMKQSFALSVMELGQFIAEPKCSFVHDPNMNTPQQGSLVKTLNINPMDKGNGSFVGISVTNKGAGGGPNISISVPMTSGELAVFRSLANYLIPRLTGFEELFSEPTDLS